MGFRGRFSAISLFVLFSTLVIAAPASFGAQGDCGQPLSSGAGPLAGDCLYILQASVGTRTCDPACICDVNAAGGATATDALLCLQKATGQSVELTCDCGVTTTTGGGTTTTIIEPTTTTTVTVTTTSTTTTTLLVPGAGQVMNEACAVCHGAGRLVDVADMHPGLQTVEDVIASIDSVDIQVDDQALTATLTVDFTVTDPDGNYIPGLADPNPTNATRLAYLRLALSRLQPAALDSGDPDTWVSYTTADRDPTLLTDNQDGTYTYVFGTNLYDLYVATERHRLLLTVSGNIVARSKNVTYDFVPEQLPGPFTFDLSRDIVTTEACDSCHGRLGSPLGTASFHGGSRYLTEACAVCHTTTLGAAGEFELAPMVHKIHAAKVVSADPVEPVDFSDVTYPQDLRNCTKCHAGTDGSHWNTRPSRTACGSCHDNVNFDTGENHVGGPQADNHLCAQCHSSSAIEGYHLTENSTPNNPNVPAGLSNFEYVIDEVTANENNEPVVTFHINKDGVPLDLTTIPPDGFSGSPSFLVAYALPQDGIDAPADYNNRGRSAAQPASVSLACLTEPVSSACTTGSAGTLSGTPDSYSAVLTAAPFPAGAKMRAVALQGYFTQLMGDPNDTADDVGRHTPAVEKPVTGDTERRQVVEIPKCLACHEIIEGHGGNRVNNVQVCVMCHNPNLSSSGRTADATKTDPAELAKIEAAGYDPANPLTWPEATNNFKDLIHGLHAAGIRDNDFEFVRNRLNGLYFNWSEVTFPGILSNCETCHAAGTFGAELPADVLVSTDVTTDGLNATQAAVTAARASVPNLTDLIKSPTVAACQMCHDGDPATAHMTQNGGVLDNKRAEALGE